MFCVVGCGTSARSESIGDLQSAGYSGASYDDETSVAESHKGEESDTEVESAVDAIDDEDISDNTAPVKMSNKQRFAPEILENNAMRVLNSPGGWRFDSDGRLISVVATDYHDNEYDMFSYEYDENGRISKITEGTLYGIYKRDSQGNIIEIENAKGGTKREYDAKGRRQYDRPYYFSDDGIIHQDYYRVFLYDDQGRRVGTEWRETSTDEVINNDIYEYDGNGHLSNVYEYQFGSLLFHREYIWNGDQFSSVNIFDDNGNLIASYNDLMFGLPIYLYEVIDY